MKLTTTGLSVVEELPYGLYLALDSQGRYIIDEEKNHLCISSRKGDRNKINDLMHAAEGFGFEDPMYEWREGASKIDDEESERQHSRMSQGLVPDDKDLGNMLDELKDGKV